MEKLQQTHFFDVFGTSDLTEIGFYGPGDPRVAQRDPRGAERDPRGAERDPRGGEGCPECHFDTLMGD